ncbi:unnamed protein product [Cylicostephanus goldi]|uniref:Uncharacterized protein n=1 Tax=Cylicostephanus goldi TaxID=71465 RepID=A0A3P6TK08_CYLGO|nr:unnamed protein product [Cylicostephanus goldi]
MLEHKLFAPVCRCRLLYDYGKEVVLPHPEFTIGAGALIHEGSHRGIHCEEHCGIGGGGGGGGGGGAYTIWIRLGPCE